MLHYYLIDYYLMLILNLYSSHTYLWLCITVYRLQYTVQASVSAVSDLDLEYITKCV